MYNTFDKTVKSLCNEIDELKEEVEYWKKRYQDEVSRSSEISSLMVDSQKKEIARAITLSLHLTDQENGDLLIKKEDRGELADLLNSI